MVTVTGRLDAARMRSTRCAASSSDAFALRWLKDSVEATAQFTRSRVVSARRS
jgi:hypothetical protein